MKKPKLSKKQLQRIARIWAANSLYAFGTDSFPDDFTQDGEVVKYVHELADIIRGEEPALYSLEKIIKYVTNQ